MNNVGPNEDARFTYYKDYRVKFFGNYNIDLPPPFAISVGAPYANQGWVKAQCPETNKSSEYDWLTFFWAVNGKAATNARSSMTNVFDILRNARGNFTWPNIRYQSDLYYGSPYATLPDDGEFGLAGCTFFCEPIGLRAASQAQAAFLIVPERPATMGVGLGFRLVRSITSEEATRW